MYFDLSKKEVGSGSCHRRIWTCNPVCKLSCVLGVHFVLTACCTARINTVQTVHSVQCCRNFKIVTKIEKNFNYIRSQGGLTLRPIVCIYFWCEFNSLGCLISVYGSSCNFLCFSLNFYSYEKNIFLGIPSCLKDIIKKKEKAKERTICAAEKRDNYMNCCSQN